MTYLIFRFAIFTAILTIIVGCATTTHRAEFVEKTKKYGGNPYMQATHVKDLEQRIRKILLAERIVGEPYGKQFDPRNQAILDNFKDSFNQAELLSEIALTKQGFKVAVAKSYPIIGNQRKCDIDVDDTYFYNTNGEPTTFNWKFERGECENGIANGVAELSADHSDAQFVGNFQNGKMIEGIFTMLRKDGARVMQIGGIPGATYSARMLWTKTNPNGYQWHLYGDFNNRGQFDGFGINISGYTNLLHVYDVGQYREDKLNGFAASQRERDWADGSIWHVWLGFHKNGKLDGWSAWTDTVDDISVSQWKDGTKHGVGYSSDYNIYESVYRYDVGTYVEGKKHGPFKVTQHGIFGENDGTIVYDRGERVEKPGSGFDWGKAIALTAGAAVIGTSNIDGASKAEIGGAFAADIIGETGGSNMQSLQNTYNSQLNNATNNSESNSNDTETGSARSTKTATKLNEWKTTINCPDTGVSNPITIPYRTEACRLAAFDFAETFGCNKTDQDRVTQNCQRACGHPQCLQQ